MNTEQLKTTKSNEIRDKIEELIGQHQALYQLLHYFEGELSQESKIAVEKDRESRWISVKERLPEDGQMVLIQSTDNAMFPVVSRYRKSHKLQFIIPYRSDLDVKNVTRWHSLPEPPKL